MLMQDCVKKAACWNSPTWQSVSSDEFMWSISCWQIDSPCGTFWARRKHCQASDVEVHDVDIVQATAMMTEGTP